MCADCGSTMVLHRAHTMKPTWNNFTCRTYKKEGSEVCTAHYIRECVLDEVILEDLRRVTAMAREQTREFAEYIGGRQSAEIQREIRRLERELTAMRKRGTELDAIFKRLYEDRVLGHISVEQFQTLSGGYTEEQEKLAPCTRWSIAQTKDRETEPEGIGWELFENYLIAMKKFKPDFSLYENNKSMAPAIRAQITRELGVEPILIA